MMVNFGKFIMHFQKFIMHFQTDCLCNGLLKCATCIYAYMFQHKTTDAFHLVQYVYTILIMSHCYKLSG